MGWKHHRDTLRSTPIYDAPYTVGDNADPVATFRAAAVGNITEGWAPLGGVGAGNGGFETNPGSDDSKPSSTVPLICQAMVKYV